MFIPEHLSFEGIHQYCHIPSEAPPIIERNRPPPLWHVDGKNRNHRFKGIFIVIGVLNK